MRVCAVSALRFISDLDIMIQQLNLTRLSV